MGNAEYMGTVIRLQQDRSHHEDISRPVRPRGGSPGGRHPPRHHQPRRSCCRLRPSRSSSRTCRGFWSSPPSSSHSPRSTCRPSNWPSRCPRCPRCPSSCCPCRPRCPSSCCPCHPRCPSSCCPCRPRCPSSCCPRCPRCPSSCCPSRSLPP